MLFFRKGVIMKNIEKSLPLKVIYFISLASFILFSYTLWVNRILPVKHRLFLIGFLVLIYVFLTWLTFSDDNRKRVKLIDGILLVFLASLFILGQLYVLKGVGAFNKLGEQQKEDILEYSLIVRKDSAIKSLEDIGKEKVFTAFNQDSEGISLFTKTLEKDKSIQLYFEKGASYQEIATNLINKKNQVILLNETFRPSILDNIHNFSEDTRIIYSTSVRKEISNPVEADPHKNHTFNMYISGIDTFGGIATVSRTDVNLLMTVNTETKTILITSIPRDTYIPIEGGGKGYYDKLTHSGIYGISSSILTLEELFDTNINYYIRVNFSSLIKVVDALGGIDVYNPQKFKSILSKHKYEKGMIHLNGEEALFFARERKHLKDGDIDRGKNHIRIIEAMIKKGMSPSILLNYNSVLDSITKAVQTNMPYNTMIDIINSQISDGSSWRIISTSVVGYGTDKYKSHAMPGNKLFLYVPFDENIEEVKREIKAVENGDNLTITEKKEEDYQENEGFSKRVKKKNKESREREELEQFDNVDNFTDDN